MVLYVISNCPGLCGSETLSGSETLNHQGRAMDQFAVQPPSTAMSAPVI